MTVEYLKAWMMSPEHIAHPYPTEQDKAQIMADTGIEMKQLTNWFVNNRKRYWKPRVEARLQQQAQAAAAASQSHAAAVAAMTAATRASPVTPDAGLKPALTVQAAAVNSFVKFDVAPSQTSGKLTIPMVGTNFAQILAAQESVHPVSEASSSASVSSSEGDSDSQTEDDLSQHASSSVEMYRESDSLNHASSSPNEQTSGEAPSQELVPNKRPLKAVESVQPPRKKFRTVSLECWRDACQNAINVYDKDLPTLEEATRLFGYA